MHLSHYKLDGKCLMCKTNKIKSVGGEDCDLVEKLHKLT